MTEAAERRDPRARCARPDQLEDAPILRYHWPDTGGVAWNYIGAITPPLASRTEGDRPADGKLVQFIGLRAWFGRPSKQEHRENDASELLPNSVARCPNRIENVSRPENRDKPRRFRTR